MIGSWVKSVLGWVVDPNPAPDCNKRVSVYAVEGAIGAGKSTLIKRIKTHLEKRGQVVLCVQEPVDEWVERGTLQKFYADPEGARAVTFQVEAFTTRIRKVRRCIAEFAEEGKAPDIIIMERSILTDMLFMKNLLSNKNVDSVDMATYYNFWALYAELMPVDLRLTTFVFLNTNLEDCMHRVQSRRRDGETSGVTETYQKGLIESHKKFVNGLERSGTNVINIDGSVCGKRWEDNLDLLTNTFRSRLGHSEPWDKIKCSMPAPPVGDMADQRHQSLIDNLPVIH